MELGPKRPSLLWFLEPDSMIVVYMDRLGMLGVQSFRFRDQGLGVKFWFRV